VVLSYWNFSEYFIELVVMNDGNYRIYINHEPQFENKNKEDCYAFVLDFVENLNLD